MGVECVRNGQSLTFGADREIILSTGGFNTPKLLMLSGIGHEAELGACDIPVHVHSAEVGKNVQDHILHGGCLYEAPEPFEYGNSAANVSGYYKTDASFELPDVSLVQIELPYASRLGSPEALRGARGHARPGAQGRGTREFHPQRGDDLLPLIRGLPDGQGRRGCGRLATARQRRAQPAHRRQHHHAAHRGRADDAGLRAHRTAAGRDAQLGPRDR